MPPRRRRGQTRMDAALDAMRPFGFPDRLIRQKVKELLNVYGDSGWAFIEEAAYSVLIEKLLEQDNASDGEQQLKSSQSEAGDAEDDTNVSAGDLEPSTLLHACSNVSAGGAGLVVQTHKVLDSSSRANDPQDEKGCISTSSNTVGCEDGETPLLAMSSPIPHHSPPIQRRRIYHGWIDSNEDETEDEDLVELTPAPLPDDLIKLLDGVQNSQDKVGLQA